MSKRYLIEGGRPLSGLYPVQGNKNAALPLIAASLLASSRVRLTRVPRIQDVFRLVAIVRELGVKADFEGDVLVLEPGLLRRFDLPDSLVRELRGSVLLFGALAARAERIRSASPGGCPIGRRSFSSHWDVFRSAGFEVSENADEIVLSRARQVSEPRVYLEESSVTATENALILFAATGQGTIQNPAREPHVLALIQFLRRLGCRIETDPLSFRICSGITGTTGELSFEVPADYIDAGTAAIAAAVTGSEIQLSGVQGNDLLGFRHTLERFGLRFEPCEDGYRLYPPGRPHESPDRVVAGPWPSFPTDLTSILIVMAGQSHGNCLVHDWMYESRMFFVDKLVRMGARLTLCDPHRVLVEGPRKLKGIRLESPDIRAGMALVVAGLCASGRTVIEHAEVIERGYERVVERLRAVGAAIDEEIIG